ncbi:MAG: hypothetical protein E6R03_18300 [Hyphomicrobiaceae bacterium]|nr:MAG: hypothetical protein E6R03_18300 [Hyphomicrobiaceae bacterium]
MSKIPVCHVNPGNLFTWQPNSYWLYRMSHNETVKKAEGTEEIVASWAEVVGRIGDNGMIDMLIAPRLEMWNHLCEVREVCLLVQPLT